jgi:hypothetical protein
MTNLQLHSVLFHSNGCKNYNIAKFTIHFTTWACSNGPKITKVRSPIPWVYVGFYTMYYWMILTTIL